MSLFDRAESKLGRFAIPNLMAYLALGQAIFLALGFIKPEIISLITFQAPLVRGPEPWRALSWLLLPPGSGSPLFAFFAIYMNWWMGMALEQSWGAFRFNVFYFTGVLAHVLLGLALPWVPITPYYLNLSLFFAFAALYPDLQLLLFFILPIKVRYLAYVAAAFLLWSLFTSSLAGQLVIAASLANFALFFIPEAWRRVHQARAVAGNQAVFHRAEEQVRRMPVKRCTVCNATVETADIRLCDCPQCGEDGRFWCLQHLQEHRKA